MTRITSKGVALGGMFWISLTNGFVFSQMTGMIKDLQKNDEGMDLSDDQIFWIATSFINTALIGFWIAAAVADKISRRWSFITFSIFLTIYWITLYNAYDIVTILLSRTLGSIAFGALLSFAVTVPSEYVLPKTRAFYLNMITTVAPALGTAMGHIIGIVLHWRNVSLLGILLSVVGIVIPYFWIESPHWLASKGKFAQCEQSFKKLHGKKSERELQVLIKLEQTKLDTTKAINSKNSFERIRLAFKKWYFWELMILSMIIYAYITAAGTVVFRTLATVMLEGITGTSDILFFTLFVDGFVIIGSLLSCVLVRNMNIRNLLFSTGVIANFVLITLSVCLYFKTNDEYFQWINVSLLAVYFIIINAGPYPVSEALISEVFPLDLKLYCFFFSGMALNIFSTLSIRLLTRMVEAMGYHGLFLVNVAIMSLSLAYIWVKLPETKGRTLQEIEVYFQTKEFDVEKALSNVQMKSLI